MVTKGTVNTDGSDPEMDEFVRFATEATDWVAQTIRRKSLDYNGSSNMWKSLSMPSLIGIPAWEAASVFVMHKIGRLHTLMSQRDSGGDDPNFESIQDNIHDLLGYVLLLIYRVHLDLQEC
jgi:hypothetical protein